MIRPFLGDLRGAPVARQAAPFKERLAALGGFRHGRVAHELMADFCGTSGRESPRRADRRAGTVGARSKGIGVNADGTCGSVTYEDTVVRGERGRRIAHRKVIARRTPLGAS